MLPKTLEVFERFEDLLKEVSDMGDITDYCMLEERRVCVVDLEELERTMKQIYEAAVAIKKMSISEQKNYIIIPLNETNETRTS